MPKELEPRNKWLKREESTGQWVSANLDPLRRALPPDLEVTEAGLITFDKLFYGLGNADTKCALLLYGLSPVPSRTFEIIDNLTRSLPAETWIPNHNGINHFMKKSLIPTGLVEKDEDEGKTTYATTTLGEGLGKDAAALFIDWAAKEGKSISDFLGFKHTASEAGMTVYLNRSTILLRLYQSPSFFAEIWKQTTLPKSSIQQNMQELKEVGLINYDSVNTEVKGWGLYERTGNGEAVPRSSIDNLLRQNIIAYFKENQVGNPAAIAQALKRRDEMDIYKILSELTETGFLKRQKWIGGEQQSDASITEKGREFVETIILPLLLASSGDQAATSLLNQIRTEIEGQPELTGQAIESYLKARERISFDDSQQALIQYLKQHGPQRPIDLIRIFGKRVEPLISGLLKSNALTKHTFSKAVYYGLPELSPPEHEQQAIIIDFQQPTDLLPPLIHPKEKCYLELFTTEFWNKLARDIETVPISVASEQKFYRFFEPDRPDWHCKDDYKSGPYSRYIQALRRMGIDNPSRFLREFALYEAPQEVITAIHHAQALMQERLLPTIENKSRDEYLEELHTTAFWKQLAADLQKVPPNTTPYYFFLYFDREHPKQVIRNQEGDYRNLYYTLGRYSGDGVYFLNEFSPISDCPDELPALIKETQELLQKRLTFMRPEVTKDGWLESLSQETFWEEFLDDINSCKLPATFGNFIAFYNEKNRKLKKRSKQDGNNYLGKYYMLPQMAFDYSDALLALPNMQDLPHDLTRGELTRFLLFRHAPLYIKDALLYRFPDDFYPIDDYDQWADFNPETNRLSSWYPDAARQNSSVVQIIDSLAGIDIKGKIALFIYNLWLDDPSEKHIKNIASMVKTTPREITEIIRAVQDNAELESAIDRIDALSHLNENRRMY